MKKEKKIFICSIVFIVVTIVITGIVYQSYEKMRGVQGDMFVSGMATVTEQSVQPTEDALEEVINEESYKEPIEKERNCCYICGAVKNPGVYEFEEGVRLDEVIALAGGFAENAATEYLNLAKAVCDSEKIYVPTVDEVEETEFTNIDKSTGNGALISDTKDKVNINVADIAELTSLPGIGTAKANSILSYREEHGKFQTIEELKNIDGIKDGVFQKIVDLIVVQ